MNTKNIILLFSTGLLMLSGCQVSTSYETSIPLVVESTDPNVPPERIDPLSVLAAVEKVAAKANMKPYTPSYEEVSLLDMADTDDLLDDVGESAINISEWKRPDLPVYLTVTRNRDEILILLNHTPDEAGKVNPDAQKLFESIQKQLTDTVP